MIPVLSSLTQLITGVVTEDFKKLFKPSALVAAGIFMALNLVLILPPLRDIRWGPVIGLEGLSTAWQIALGTLLLFILAYVFNSLGSAFLSVASGTAFKDSPVVGEALVCLQRRTYKDLCHTVKSGSHTEKQERAQAEWRLAFEFPNKDALAPTRLGNVLASASAYTFNKYGAHLNTLWPYMDIVLNEKDDELRNQLAENRDALTFLATLSGLLNLIALEFAVVYLVVGPRLRSLWAGVFLIVAYAVYSAAVRKGKAWGRDIRTAFDLYLDEVAEELGLPALGKAKWKKAREHWQEASVWFAYGGLKDDDSEIIPPSWYKASEAKPQLHHPTTVSVKPVVETIHYSPKISNNKQTCHYYQVADYLYTITNEETGEHAREADAVYLLVTDTRLVESPKKTQPGKLTRSVAYGIPKKPPYDKVKAKRLPNGKSFSLLWYIGRVAPKSSRVLQYTIKDIKHEVTVSPNSFKVVDVWEKSPSTKPNEKQLWIKFEGPKQNIEVEINGLSYGKYWAHYNSVKSKPKLVNFVPKDCSSWKATFKPNSPCFFLVVTQK